VSVVAQSGNSAGQIQFVKQSSGGCLPDLQLLVRDQSSAGSGRVDGYRCRRGASEIRVGKVPVGFQVENRGWSFWLRYDENPARGIERRTPRLGDGNRSGGPPLYAFAPQGKEEQARSAVSDHFVGTGTDERERTCVICPVRTLEVGVLERIHLKEIVG